MKQPKVIPNYINQNQSLIPEKLSIPTDPSDKEDRPFRISYSFYKQNLCEIDLLEKNRARQALKDLKVVGKVKNRTEFQQNGIDLIDVKNEGDYKKLFSAPMTPDVDIKEHKIQGDARIFYFLDEVEKVFHLIAITNNHYETDKQRG